MSEDNYYLESNKTNNNSSTNKDNLVSGTHRSLALRDTPYPTLTDSQQIKLNNILHTGKLTNCNISTFSDYEFADSSFVEDVLDDSPEITKCLNASEIEKGCCYLI